MSARTQSVHFPNLDALRFFSFFTVFVFHCFVHFPVAAVDSVGYRAARRLLTLNEQGGELGVSFFFVLSGFLITYLMLKEQQSSGRLHVGWFYLRRALRIWPLYFAVVLVGFFVWPSLVRLTSAVRPAEVASPLAFLLFFANFDALHHGPPTAPVLGVQWSLAIEEQFYLVWPLLFATFHRKSGRAFAAVVGALLVASLAFRVRHVADATVLYYHTFSVMGDLATGAAAACAIVMRPTFTTRLAQLSRARIVIVYAAGIAIVAVPSLFPGGPLLALRRLFIAAFFAFIILEQNFATRSLFKLGRLRRVTRLGQYTYGLYSLHMFAIIAVKLVLRTPNSPFVLRSTLALGGAIAISVLSYHLFEVHFLRLKERFSIVKRASLATSPTGASVRDPSTA